MDTSSKEHTIDYKGFKVKAKLLFPKGLNGSKPRIEAGMITDSCTMEAGVLIQK
jgi:hypothetical protein